MNCFRFSLFISLALAACAPTETSSSAEVGLCSGIPCDSDDTAAPAIGVEDIGSTDEIIYCDDCDGEAPDVPSQLCKDGTVAGPICVSTPKGACVWTITVCPDGQPTDCSAVGCGPGQHCETDCFPCDAPDPETPCDSFACQSTCVPD